MRRRVNCPFPAENALRWRRRRGILLMEMLVYIAIFAIVTGVAFSVFFKFWDSARQLEVNADRIIRTLIAGEHWRKDVRSATGPLRLTEIADQPVLQIPQDDRTVSYRADSDGVWRRNGDDQPWTRVLAEVEQSEVVRDPRQFVTAWRWDLKLRPTRKDPRVQPRFTFLAVPTAADAR